MIADTAIAIALLVIGYAAGLTRGRVIANDELAATVDMMTARMDPSITGHARL